VKGIWVSGSRPAMCVSALSALSSSSSLSRALSTTAERVKHRIPKKRASALLDTLKKETFEELKGVRAWPEFRAGDSIEVKRLPYVTATEPEVVKGVVIAKTSKGADTTVTIINVEYGTPIVRQLKIYNPTIVDVKVLEEAFIHGGKKRVRRSKLYYLLDRDPQEYTVR